MNYKKGTKLLWNLHLSYSSDDYVLCDRTSSILRPIPIFDKFYLVIRYSMNVIKICRFCIKQQTL